MYYGIRDLLEWKEQHIGCDNLTINMSMYEIFAEEINDLLQEGAVNLRIMSSDDPVSETITKGLTEICIHTINDFNQVLVDGDLHRIKLNSDASRSHILYRIHILGCDKISGTNYSNSLYVVDLLGSERKKASGAYAYSLKQGSMIGLGAGALGNVIYALSKSVITGKPHHIPYRDSKLTRILHHALGGNCYTSMLCTVIGNESHHDEALNTLRYGNRIGLINNSVKLIGESCD